MAYEIYAISYVEFVCFMKRRNEDKSNKKGLWDTEILIDD